MTDGRRSGSRFDWLGEEEDFLAEPVAEPAREDPGTLGGTNPPWTEEPGPDGGSAAVPAFGGVLGRAPGVDGRRRRNRPKNPKALRNDPGRKMACARIRKDVRRRVDQALADPAVAGEADTNYSLLVEALLVRWLEDVGYPVENGG